MLRCVFVLMAELLCCDHSGRTHINTNDGEDTVNIQGIAGPTYVVTGNGRDTVTVDDTNQVIGRSNEMLGIVKLATYTFCHTCTLNPCVLFSCLYRDVRTTSPPECGQCWVPTMAYCPRSTSGHCTRCWWWTLAWAGRWML